jgi:aryl-alcohol dehydrogenase-like predicted oxidoreductase
MELALGTVQFGVAYGISGAEELLSDQQIRMILELAFKGGITHLDTAPAYGEVESKLRTLCEGLDFKVISKIPQIPPELKANEAARWVLDSAQTSRERLSGKLTALLFHHAGDLLGARGEEVWNAAREWALSENILMGASAYDVKALEAIHQDRGIAIAQLPGNAFDQGLLAMRGATDPGLELHLRSAFLQGLLLLPLDVASIRVPAAAVALQKWHSWLSARSMSPLHGALSIVKGFENVSTCVIGVDNISQLREILKAWNEVQAIHASELACDDLRIIDPRQWSEVNQ